MKPRRTSRVSSRKRAGARKLLLPEALIPWFGWFQIGAAQGRRKLGFLKGKLVVGPEFFEPLPEDELKRWE